MNAIKDLTARAISFITAIQTTLLKGAIADGKKDQSISILTLSREDLEATLVLYATKEEAAQAIDPDKSPGNSSSKNREKIYAIPLNKREEDGFAVKAIELIWMSKKKVDQKYMVKWSVTYAIFLAGNLVKWINDNRKYWIANMQEINGNYPSPFMWREAISKILYADADQRVELAKALEYLPMQVVLALGAGRYTAYRERILQSWDMKPEVQATLLDQEEMKWINQFKETFTHDVNPETLLRNTNALYNQLIQALVPLSFEQIFDMELKEIQLNRERRMKEEIVAKRDTEAPGNAIKEVSAYDPFERAEQMSGLTALAFSGGGIRSATFNLGILQGLASKNLIKKFDYLSTVSGGGYIGSWLAAWIKRDGSLVKVTNRLCTDLSPDPSGEELRPIKWLRMFSNYFSPNTSIMSADAWTVGVTWLRNTLLNQTIIFLSLLSLLFLGNLLFIGWSDIARQTISSNTWQVFFYSLITLAPVSLLAGLGMQAYHSQGIRWLKIRKQDTIRINKILLLIAFVSAYVIAAWLSSDWAHDDIKCLTFRSKVLALWPAALVNFGSLMIVAVLGKYAVFIQDLLRKLKFSKILAWTMLIITAAITAAVSWICLAAAWALMQKIDNITVTYFTRYHMELKFILGFPLVLEVFSITLVARMGLLGRYFPDERREWWGRMGAYIHRTSFLWLLIASAALLGKDFILYVFMKSPFASTAVTGGWAAMIFSAVKAAFSSKVSGEKKSASTLSSLVNVLALIGPYLFALGLLIFLPGLITPIYNLVYYKVFHNTVMYDNFNEFYIICIIAFCFVIALLLSMQVGVNEFSMHHFYRNRLVRAYLGATRRATDRQKSSNPFTGFDLRDDEKLANMKNKYGYYGPFPILNATLNASQVTDLDRQDRKAESFVFTPYHCGFDFSMLKAGGDLKVKSYDYAYRQTKDYAFSDRGPTIGTAMAISGASVNPNQGYHSSAATAFLLTVFNVQMGWWMGNPRKSTWQRSEPRFGLGYIFNNLVGKTNTRSDYVALSDGGHFDNMGLYELIRRKCRYIILCDGEQDGEFTCEGFANAIRKCRIDFGVDISIDISKIVTRKDGKFSECHYALGDIKYTGNVQPGKLLYIKSSIVEKDFPVDVMEYAKKNSSFPHQTTADQFFNEEQFESYRKLGLWIADKAFNDKILAQLKL
ncbi:patatin-like phospholipase family protein [Flavitalea sp.]|nr:patatin-like phospholipase family protein [Flavitalea sp.]